MTVLREDNHTFLKFHKYARPSLDNRLTTLFDQELNKVPFLPVKYIVLYITDSSFLVTRYQYCIILKTRITHIGERANTSYSH